MDNSIPENLKVGKVIARSRAILGKRKVVLKISIAIFIDLSIQSGAVFFSYQEENG